MTKSDPLAGLVVLNDGTDREAWLEARKGEPGRPVITATQAAAIVGSHPYTKIIDVWNEKTDPDYDRDAERNMWLEERAILGTQREPEILAWASADPLTGGSGNPFIPNTKLLARAENPGHASTPDGYKTAREGRLVLVECKATQQRWDEIGLPQHIYDQALWQLYTTGAITVWIAAEFYEWTGKGKNKTATLVGRWLYAVQMDEKRLGWILSKVERFEQMLADGIAPESDLDVQAMADAAADLDPFEDGAAEILADAAAAAHLLELDTERGEIVDRITADQKRLGDIDAEIKAATKAYDGRRVWMAAPRFIAKLTRGTRTVVATEDLPEATLRSITSWVESETVKIEPNPTYVAPATTDNERE